MLCDRHEPSAKPHFSRTLNGRGILYFGRHTKPGQRLQLVDVGRARRALPLEHLQPWRPGQPRWRRWQLAAAREGFSAGAREVRAHMPHACNIEDEMRMAAVPHYSSRYLPLLNHNFRDWPGVTINGDGAPLFSSPPCTETAMSESPVLTPVSTSPSCCIHSSK